VQEPYQYIIFRASEVKDLSVDEPATLRSIHDDPAVIGVRIPAHHIHFHPIFFLVCWTQCPWHLFPVTWARPPPPAPPIFFILRSYNIFCLCIFNTDCRLYYRHPHLTQQTGTHNILPRLRSRCLSNNLSNNHMCRNNHSNNRRTLWCLAVRIQVAVMDSALPT
jgi:hypothetical protein